MRYRIRTREGDKAPLPFWLGGAFTSISKTAHKVAPFRFLDRHEGVWMKCMQRFPSSCRRAARSIQMRTLIVSFSVLLSLET